MPFQAQCDTGDKALGWHHLLSGAATGINFHFSVLHFHFVRVTKGKMMPNSSVKNLEIDTEKAVPGSLIIEPFCITERNSLLKIFFNIKTKKST